MKTCPKCGEEKAVTDFHLRSAASGLPVSTCKVCVAVYKRAWKIENKDRVRAKDAEYRESNRAKIKQASTVFGLAQFGLTVEAYGDLLARQHEGCAICGLSCKSGNRLAVDHDHRTGTVRGLLCGSCNRAIGLLKDNTALLERAISYLERT